MVTSPGKEVDNTSFLTKVSLFFYVLLPLAIDKPPKDLRDFTHAVSASLLMPPRTMIMAKSKSGEEKKKLYITFDDGPNRGTRNVLRIAEEEEVPVSFFVVGRNAFASPLQNQLWD